MNSSNEYRKRYKQTTKARKYMSVYNKQYYKRNKKKRSLYDSAYYQENKTEKNKQRLAYQITRRKNDPEFKLRCYLRTRLYTALKNQTANKKHKTFQLLGCKLEQLQKHIEKRFRPGMSWTNYGEWHIDHITPCSSFDLTKVKEQKKCFRYSNLQPLWAIENMRKGNK